MTDVVDYVIENKCLKSQVALLEERQAIYHKALEMLIDDQVPHWICGNYYLLDWCEQRCTEMAGVKCVLHWAEYELNKDGKHDD